MIRRVRAHLSFANVASALALCLAVGGGTTAIALSGKGSVDSGDLRNGQVKTRDLGRNAATGKKVAEGTLGIVPDAAHAEDSDRLGGIPDLNYQLGNGGTGAIAGLIDVGSTGAIDLGSARLRVACADPSVTLDLVDEAGAPVPTASAPTDVWIDGDHDALATDGDSSAGVTVAAAESTTPVQVWTTDNVVTDARFDLFLDHTAPAPDQCLVTMPFSQNFPAAGVEPAAAADAARLPAVRAYGFEPR